MEIVYTQAWFTLVKQTHQKLQKTYLLHRFNRKIFKDRFYENKNYFRYESKCNVTGLPNFIRENKRENINTTLE